RGSPRAARGRGSRRDESPVVRLSRRPILSLDTKGTERLGPAILHEDAGLWPSTVIVMTLARVGVGAGPDLESLRGVLARAPGRRVIAAGGVRDLADCQ